MRFAEQGKETRPRAASQYYCVEPGLSRLNISWLTAKIRAFFGVQSLLTGGYAAGNSVNCPHWASFAGSVIADN